MPAGAHHVFFAVASAGSAAVEVVGYGLMGDKGSLDRHASIASITKTMTAYVVLKDHPLRASESGPTITLTSEMAAEYGEFRVYVVEVCQGCGWNHLVCSYVLGTGEPVVRRGRRARTSQ